MHFGMCLQRIFRLRPEVAVALWTVERSDGCSQVDDLAVFVVVVFDDLDLRGVVLVNRILKERKQGERGGACTYDSVRIHVDI